MSSLGAIGARWLVVVVPLSLFGCFIVGDDTGGDEGDGGGGSGDASECRSSDDCPPGRVCIDLEGNRDDICDRGERCACAADVTGDDDNGSIGGSSGAATGGNSSGGAPTGGNAQGGNTTGGNTTGGNTTGGNTTGGNTTGGNTTGGNATGGAGRGGSTTGGSGGAADCGAYCTRLVGAMCAATTQTACLAECNGLQTDCPAEAPAVRSCIANPANPLACVGGSATITGCDTELDARDRCLVCVPETADTTCIACSKRSCCEAYGDYGLAPDGANFYACASACTTSDCFDACVRTFPIGGNALLDLFDCQDASCPEPCICAADAADDTCTACSKSSCCSQYVDYLLAPDLADFEACATPCADSFCVDECADGFPTAGAAFHAWSDCADQNCFDECS